MFFVFLFLPYFLIVIMVLKTGPNRPVRLPPIMVPVRSDQLDQIGIKPGSNSLNRGPTDESDESSYSIKIN